MSKPSASWEDVARVRQEVIERKDAEIEHLRAEVERLTKALSEAEAQVACWQAWHKGGGKTYADIRPTDAAGERTVKVVQGERMRPRHIDTDEY